MEVPSIEGGNTTRGEGDGDGESRFHWQKRLFDSPTTGLEPVIITGLHPTVLTVSVATRNELAVVYPGAQKTRQHAAQQLRWPDDAC